MNKNLFHTITIKIPKDQVYITKNNTVTIVPTLNKSNNITKKLGIPSIILKPDEHILHPEVEKGELVDISEEKRKQKEIKKNQPKKERKIKEPKEKKEEKSSLTRDDIKKLSEIKLKSPNIDKPFNVQKPKPPELEEPYKPIEPIPVYQTTTIYDHFKDGARSRPEPEINHFN